MKSKCAVAMAVMMVLAVAFAIPRMQHANSQAMAQPNQETNPMTNELPPLPVGVTELKFSEFFVTPVGPRGLALTDKLSSLNCQRVRLLGYMVRQEARLPGSFLFSAIPVQLHDHDSSDDLPPAVVHVSVPTCREEKVPYAPGLMLLTGTLSIGHREEADGRMSLVRLALDPPARGKGKASSFTGKGAGLASSRHSAAR
jgi:hypothetical protein